MCGAPSWTLGSTRTRHKTRLRPASLPRYVRESDRSQFAFVEGGLDGIAMRTYMWWGAGALCNIQDCCRNRELTYCDHCTYISTARKRYCQLPI